MKFLKQLQLQIYESVEVHVDININPKSAEQQLHTALLKTEH